MAVKLSSLRCHFCIQIPTKQRLKYPSKFNFMHPGFNFLFLFLYTIVFLATHFAVITCSYNLYDLYFDPFGQRIKYIHMYKPHRSKYWGMAYG